MTDRPHPKLIRSSYVGHMQVMRLIMAVRHRFVRRLESANPRENRLSIEQVLYQFREI